MANTAVVYGRSIAGRELTFEASGALWDASLVMRDRETDSWWSIMTPGAIGGPLAGTPLAELPVSEKTTWGSWRARHPDTRVLSVDGVEHVERDPYADYLASDETFRGIEPADGRLPAKAAIFAFRLDGRAWAAPHEAFAGGRLFEVEGSDRAVLLFRRAGAPRLESSRAYLVERTAVATEELLRRAAQGDDALEPLPGIDTFWYTWSAVHAGTGLLR